jgi:hypothetical protein
MHKYECNQRLVKNFLTVVVFQTAAQVPSLHPLVGAGLNA